MINTLNCESLRAAYRSAKPFPFVQIDDFLDREFAAELASSFPSRQRAAALGREFTGISERGKIQVTDPAAFPSPIAKLNELLASPRFLKDVERITGIDDLLVDTELVGGGMHCTGPRGRLDVHVDFNLLEEKGWHRRLNILLYLNPHWEESWGGAIELWDRQVKRCHQRLLPKLNRCVIFETSEFSYHGVSPVTCPEGVSRNSFAAYYYTEKAPENWDGVSHSTVFRSRPSERMRRYVLVPLSNASREAGPRIKRGIKRALGPALRAGRRLLPA